ncbi:MAG: hypothetical protein C0497_13920 [Gemmatimonas sp.]|nr:hypothetical protein [Gemmatimonas sp.]
MAWLVGGFLFCPCHLPITLALFGVLFAGTVLGAVLQQYVLLVALLTTAIWLAASWYGLRLMSRSTRAVK